MPRHARIKSKSQVYHVMLRGNNKEKIFIDDDDKARIIDTIADKKQAGEFSVFAYCVMDNHIHLLIKEEVDMLPRIIKRVGASYSYYFNKKYKRIGHVFQDRYRSENIEDDRYLLAAIRYIHQNPLKAGIGSIEGYTWSGYMEYISGESGMVETREILGMVSDNNKKALKEFARFNHEVAGEVFIDVAEDKKIDETNVDEYIHCFLADKGLILADLKDSSNRQARDEIIKLLLGNSNFSSRGIALLLGLNREMVRKVGVSKEPSP